MRIYQLSMEVTFPSVRQLSQLAYSCIAAQLSTRHTSFNLPFLPHHRFLGGGVVDPWSLLHTNLLAQRALLVCCIDRLNPPSSVAASQFKNQAASCCTLYFDDADEEHPDVEFKRPTGVTGQDWLVYRVVRLACAEFNKKAKAMWA